MLPCFKVAFEQTQDFNVHDAQYQKQHIPYQAWWWKGDDLREPRHHAVIKLLSLPKYFIVKVIFLTAWMKFGHVTGQ